MRKHTSATPAGIPRNRSGITRRVRLYARAVIRWEESQRPAPEDPIFDQFERLLWVNKIKWHEGNRSRFVVSPAVLDELFMETFEAPPASTGKVTFRGFPVLVEPAWTRREWRFTSARTSTEQRARELWVRHYAMALFMDHDWTKGVRRTTEEFFAMFYTNMKDTLEHQYDQIQEKARFSR